MADPDDLVLIWSNEHRCWWKPNRHGYTLWIEEAGRYPRADAEQICANANLVQNEHVPEGYCAEAIVPLAAATRHPADTKFRADVDAYQAEIGESVERLRGILDARPGTGLANLVSEVERRLAGDGGGQ